MYSGCPKTGRPVWQTGHNCVRFSNVRLSDVWLLSICPVIGQIEFNWTSDNRTILSGFQTYSIVQTSDNRTKLSGSDTKLVPTGLEPVSACVLYHTCQNRFGTGSKSVSAPGCPVGSNWNRTSDNRTLELEPTGQFGNRTTFENAKIRTSGFRTSTVFKD